MAETREEFIKKVYNQTYQMAQDNGLPHDFIMAQVIQETGWGKHILKDTNNIFNIKTGSSWKGKKSTHNVWEVINGKKVWVDADFRKYDSYGDSVKDWLKFLKKNKRYKALFEKENLSTSEFAKRIQKAGYATDPNYAKNIVNITKGKTYKSLIAKAKESYDGGDVSNKKSSSNTYIVDRGDYLGTIANRYGMSVDELLDLNPKITNKNSISIGQKINVFKKKKTVTSENEKIVKKENKSEVPSSNTWDTYTNQRIQKIHPLIRNNATQFINSVQKKLDIKLRVTTGMRTVQQQNDLYKKGRTEKGKKVTWVKGGYSYHNYGLAIDVVEIKNKHAKWNTKWKDISKIGKEKGFEWGGDWKDVSDKPHFQKTFGYTTKQLKKRLELGKVKNGFVDIDAGDTSTKQVDIQPKEIVVVDKNNDYNVKRGDNLSKISKKYNISLAELLRLNPQIEDKNKISIGQTIHTSKVSPIINVDLENKSHKLFKKLGLKHEKIPTLNHNQNLPSNVEGMYKKDDLSLKKNPRVSDKKAEAVAMHEIYHHSQKDKGLDLGQEETQANMIEKAYLNENQQDTQEIDFDLIYAYTIKQFYEHEELEKLVCILGGDGSSVRRIYSNAMCVITESKTKNSRDKNSIKKVLFDSSGIKYKEPQKIYNDSSTTMTMEQFNKSQQLSIEREKIFEPLMNIVHSIGDEFERINKEAVWDTKGILNGMNKIGKGLSRDIPKSFSNANKSPILKPIVEGAAKGIQFNTGNKLEDAVSNAILGKLLPLPTKIITAPLGIIQEAYNRNKKIKSWRAE